MAEPQKFGDALWLNNILKVECLFEILPVLFDFPPLSPDGAGGLPENNLLSMHFILSMHVTAAACGSRWSHVSQM